MVVRGSLGLDCISFTAITDYFKFRLKQHTFIIWKFCRSNVLHKQISLGYNQDNSRRHFFLEALGESPAPCNCKIEVYIFLLAVN